jgi:hypothetical protein
MTMSPNGDRSARLTLVLTMVGTLAGVVGTFLAFPEGVMQWASFLAWVGPAGSHPGDPQPLPPGDPDDDGPSAAGKGVGVKPSCVPVPTVSVKVASSDDEFAAAVEREVLDRIVRRNVKAAPWPFGASVTLAGVSLGPDADPTLPDTLLEGHLDAVVRSVFPASGEAFRIDGRLHMTLVASRRQRPTRVVHDIHASGQHESFDEALARFARAMAAQVAQVLTTA